MCILFIFKLLTADAATMDYVQDSRICPLRRLLNTQRTREWSSPQASFRCLTRVQMTKEWLTPATRSVSATTPNDGPARRRHGSIRSWRQTDLTPPDLWRPHRPSYSRYEGVRETAPSRAEADTLITPERDPWKREDRPPRSAEGHRLPQDARITPMKKTNPPQTNPTTSVAAILQFRVSSRSPRYPEAVSRAVAAYLPMVPR
jgi:hypothetical protein